MPLVVEVLVGTVWPAPPVISYNSNTYTYLLRRLVVSYVRDDDSSHLSCGCKIRPIIATAPGGTARKLSLEEMFSVGSL